MEERRQRICCGCQLVENRGYSSSIPKPVIERLGNPESIKYVFNDDNQTIQLVSGSSPVFKSERVKPKKHG